MTTDKRLISVEDCPCDGCHAKPCGHPARCVKFALWLNKTVDAVEAVRCKGCKESDPCDVSRGRVWCKRMCRYMDENGFCSEGRVDEALQQLP